ncbi:MAG: LamG domain-containing protein, partial [Okeania sp. SIO3B5]|uniref:LamG domain-containing protein n=1 Tax=Okeania sp. SIO3B5 TaxID=2607811 RepID=UPI001401A118
MTISTLFKTTTVPNNDSGHQVKLTVKETASPTDRITKASDDTFGSVLDFKASTDSLDLTTTPVALLQTAGTGTSGTTKQINPDIKNLDTLFRQQPGNFSLCVWVYYDTIPSGDQTILSHTSSSNTVWTLKVNKTNSAIFEIYDENKTSHSLSVAKPLIPNTWVQIAVTYNFFTLTVYINGRAISHTSCLDTSFRDKSGSLKIDSTFKGRLGQLSFADYIANQLYESLTGEPNSRLENLIDYIVWDDNIRAAIVKINYCKKQIDNTFKESGLPGINRLIYSLKRELRSDFIINKLELVKSTIEDRDFPAGREELMYCMASINDIEKVIANINNHPEEPDIEDTLHGSLPTDYKDTDDLKDLIVHIINNRYDQQLVKTIEQRFGYNSYVMNFTEQLIEAVRVQDDEQYNRLVNSIDRDLINQLISIAKQIAQRQPNYGGGGTMLPGHNDTDHLKQLLEQIDSNGQINVLLNRMRERFPDDSINIKNLINTIIDAIQNGNANLVNDIKSQYPTFITQLTAIAEEIAQRQPPSDDLRLTRIKQILRRDILRESDEIYDTLQDDFVPIVDRHQPKENPDTINDSYYNWKHKKLNSSSEIAVGINIPNSLYIYSVFTDGTIREFSRQNLLQNHSKSNDYSTKFSQASCIAADSKVGASGKRLVVVGSYDHSTKVFDASNDTVIELQ